jgi:GMP synthase-like glutamine amidotransferase
MRPVAIFRHSPTEGPGYLADYLERRDVPWRLFRVDAGDALPSAIEPFSGLVFMGGPMSVNDDLPWIPPVLELIASAVAKDMPVLGHCLGGQLMAKALGGTVARAPVKEIGWGEVEIPDNEAARAWFGHGPGHFLTFHWHGETFTVPAGATRVLSSRYCRNQGFALGPHLGLQCHIEMTQDLVRTWCTGGRREIERSQSPAVQPVAEILTGLDARVAALHAVADTVYARWVDGLRHR